MSVTKQEAGDKPTINGFAKRVSGSSVSDKLSPQEEKSPLFPFPGKNNKFIQDVSPGKTTWNSLETSMWETPETRGSLIPFTWEKAEILVAKSNGSHPSV